MKVSILIILLGAYISFASTKTPINKDCQLMKNKEMEMEVISTNIENLNTTKTPEGGPYKSKKLLCKDNTCAIVSYKGSIKRYEPRHPDADSSGYVQYPNVDLMTEMQSMIDARTVYEQASRNCKANRVM